MTYDQQPRKQEMDVNVSFKQPPPRPAKVHRARDIAWITIAAGLVGTAVHSSTVFAVVACASIVLYVVGGPIVRK